MFEDKMSKNKHTLNYWQNIIPLKYDKFDFVNENNKSVLKDYKPIFIIGQFTPQIITIKINKTHAEDNNLFTFLAHLEKYNIDSDLLAGLIPLSGHTITHMTVREEMGIPIKRPYVDKMSPLFHIRDKTPPYIMITGDRDLELLGRYEENAYMHRMMKVVGNENSELYELEGLSLIHI